MPVIRSFIEAKTARQKEIADALPDDHNKDWTALNTIFREMISGQWRRYREDVKYAFKENW